MEFEIQGVENSRVRDNISLLLKTTDIENQESLDGFWQKQVRDTVSKAVEAFGYYNSSTDISEADDKIILTIALGDPLIVANVTREIIGEGRSDAGFSKTFNDFPLNVGDVLYQPDYESFKSNMFNYALSNGFFDFTWQATRLDLVRDAKQANIILIAQSGPQYYFGDLVIKGDVKAKALIEQLRPFSAGEKYSAEKLTQYNRILNDTGFFQRVIARPVVKNAINKRVPIEVTLVHRPRDNFNVGIGFSTDIGLRVPFRWERPWVNSKGHSFTADMFVSEREQEVNARYRIPMDDVANDYATIESRYYFLDDSNRATESETFSFAGKRFFHESGSKWFYNASLSYQRENFTQGTADPTTTQLLLPGVAANYLDVEGDLGNRQGLSFSSTLELGRKEVVSDIDVFKATARARWIRNYGKHRLYLRGELGVISTNQFDRVPATMRFFIGGDQSIRGFEFESLSSGDFEIIDGEEKFVPRGGRYLTTASVEYAYPVAENWRAAVFFDAGVATNSFDEGIERGMGIGVHWLTLVGPVRLYLAYGRSEVRRESQTRLHFILGPEL